MAGTDFSHLTNDELIKGIKALDLPDYIRSKAYGIDVRETLAQMTEMTIQLGVNMGLSPDDALNWARKLQESVSQSEFDSWIATLLDGGPSIFMNTLSELQSTYPNGAAGVALVRETDPAKIYVWNGSAWEDFGDYQGIEIKDGSISSSKIIDETITADKLNLVGVDTLPRNFTFNFADGGTRAITAMVYFESGDYITAEVGVQFALLNSNDVALVSYGTVYKFSQSAHCKIKVKKIDNTTFSDLELESLKRKISVRNAKSLANYETAQKFVNSKVENFDGIRLNQISDVKLSSNLFNPQSALVGTMVSGDGRFSQNANYFTALPIYAGSESKIITVSYCRSYDIYDESGEYAKIGLNTNDNLAVKTIEIPKNHHIYISGHVENLSKMQINVGETLLDYEEYYVEIDKLKVDYNSNKISGLKVGMIGDSIAAASTSGIVGYNDLLVEDGAILSDYSLDGAKLVAGDNSIQDQLTQLISENDNLDVILVEGQTNDITSSSSPTPLGSISDSYTEEFDTQTFSGALENIFKQLKIKYLGALVIYIRVHQMDSRNSDLQKQYGERAMEIAEKWSVPVCDLYKSGGLNSKIPQMKQQFTLTNKVPTGDGTHPNSDGYLKYYYPRIKSEILKGIE